MSEPTNRTAVQTYFVEPFVEASGFYKVANDKAMHYSQIADQYVLFDIRYLINSAEARFPLLVVSFVEWTAAGVKLLESIMRLALGIFALMSGEKELITTSLKALVSSVAHAYFSLVATVGAFLSPNIGDAINSTVRESITSLFSNEQLSEMANNVTLGTVNVLQNAVVMRSEAG